MTTTSPALPVGFGLSAKPSEAGCLRQAPTDRRLYAGGRLEAALSSLT
ncbi:MAG: hypothetical protein NZ585_03860 [Chloracidobacterium sp.]|nr:hypothetical protein [Chloracidobacterium sp.]MDW8217508.1 hypothetical protein [Acidobacteriota bacterium]